MAWTPADLGTTVLGWYEARDLEGVVADGGAVSSWSDKSSFGRTLTQATASQQPSFQEVGRHDMPAVRADGGDLLRNTALGSPFHGQADGYISFVFSTASSNAGKYVVSCPNTSGGNGVDLGLSTGGVVGNLKSNAAFSGITSGLSWGAGLVYLAEQSWDFGLASNDQTVTGGDATAATATVAGATTAAALAEFNVLNFGTGFAAGYTGDLYAVLCCDRPLTTTELDHWRQYCYENFGAITAPFTATYPSPTAPTATTYSNLVVADGADLYWRLGEGGPAGAGAYDMSGNGRTGIYAGSPATATGLLEGDADGGTACSGDDIVYRYDEAFLDTLFAGSYTIEGWFAISGNATNRRLCGKYQAPATGSADTSSALGLILVNPSGDLYFYSGSSADANACFTTAGDVNDGVPHHVVAQRDTSFSPVKLRLYIDGELIVERNEAATPVANNRAFQVGGDGSHRYLTERWVGTIDEFALYSEVLTATQVHDHHCAGRPSRCRTLRPTVGYIGM